MIGTGIDIVHIPSFAQLTADTASAFVNDHFTTAELEYCERAVGDRTSHFAARYAAKEAAIKALEEAHLFRPKLVAQVSYREIEVCKDPGGRPYLMFHGIIAKIVESLQAKAYLSMSHDSDYAIASVILS